MPKVFSGARAAAHRGVRPARDSDPPACALAGSSVSPTLQDQPLTWRGNSHCGSTWDPERDCDALSESINLHYFL